MNECSARKDSTISRTGNGGAVAGAGFGFDLSDFFAMARFDSLAAATLADELLAKSQEGGPVFDPDIRYGSQNCLHRRVIAAKKRWEGERPGG